MSLTTHERPSAPTFRTTACDFVLVVAMTLALALGAAAMHHAPAVIHLASVTHTIQSIHHAATACGGVNLPCIPQVPATN